MPFIQLSDMRWVRVRVLERGAKMSRVEYRDNSPAGIVYGLGSNLNLGICIKKWIHNWELRSSQEEAI